MRLALKPRAERDLDDIFSYSEEAWGFDQAVAYIRGLHAVMQRICRFPRMGRPADEIRAGIRISSAGSHLILYRIGEEQVDVIRILHKRMDIDQHL
ncbi:MAG: type II toxin-antitoxin system RelE/ParE family toxin [Phreatobacter sp.]|uniref:type II toxin-antitoxin system RelE/ParE family toxin n=1 Tax=Phreatobacter sp. TaxID=1966341 RepID=UPI001A5C769F|nr:type II toxin-antitoxin system RelE/ParE family toxin [Phreatobacter sp.]MBL8568514.1 type II toxin-antitoxin system RelE/ParE family toxin [Phreatobacter sp.]